MWPFEINQDGGGHHLEFVRIENSAIRSAFPENPTIEQNIKWIGRSVAEISPLEIFPAGGGRHLGFVRTVNSAVRSAVPKNPTLKSVHGFRSWKTLKNGISHWKRSSPLQQCCATAQTVISHHACTLQNVGTYTWDRHGNCCNCMWTTKLPIGVSSARVTL